MTDHAIANARAWLTSIEAGMNALNDLQNGAESVSYDGETFEDTDTLRERLEQSPLSVQVRGGWYTPGGEAPDPEEFEILLSTGGPALRITGDIGGTPFLQFQDWGTPWTDYTESTAAEDDALVDYVALFYVGD